MQLPGLRADSPAFDSSHPGEGQSIGDRAVGLAAVLLEKLGLPGSRGPVPPKPFPWLYLRKMRIF